MASYGVPEPPYKKAISASSSHFTLKSSPQPHNILKSWPKRRKPTAKVVQVRYFSGSVLIFLQGPNELRSGNVGPASAAHTVEHHAGEPGNVTGRGGEGNIAAGAGHYDESGGHHVSASAGKGGLGNLHSKKGHDRKTSVVDQIIGE